MAGLLGQLSGQVRLDIRQAVAAYATLRAQHARTIYALRGTGDALVGAGQSMATVGAVGVFAFYKMVQAAAEFERKMDFFAAVTDTSAKQIQKVQDAALDLAKSSIYSADQIAEGFVELGKAGVDARMIIEGIGQAMVNLGAAGDIPLAQSGQIITSTIQQFDLAAKDAVEVTDLLAGAANASIADISDIGVSLKYVGGVANAVGLTFEDTTTAISLLAKAGIRGSTAGTSLRQMLVSLGGATGPARESLTKLGIITEDGGNKFFDAQGKAKSLSQIFQILQDSTSDLTQKQRLMHLRTIFNNRALSAASILTREGAKGFREMNREMLKVSAADVASERLDNLSGDIEILRSNIRSLLIESGGPFQETLRGWVQSITKLVQAFGKLDPKTQKMIIQTVAIGSAALVAMGLFTIFLGVVLKFIVAVIRLVEGLKFLKKSMGIVFKGATFKGFLKGAGIIGAVVLALKGVSKGMDKLAEKIPIVDRFWGAWKEGYDEMGQIGGTLSFVEELYNFGNERSEGRLGEIVEELKQFPSQVKDALADLPDQIRNAMDEAPGAFSNFVDQARTFFSELPGMVWGYATEAADALGRGLDAAPGKIAEWAGQIWSSFTSGLGRLVDLALRYGSRVVTSFIAGLRALPGQIGYVIGWAIGRLLQLFIKMAIRATELAGRLREGVIRVLTRLPGQIGSLAGQVYSRMVSWFQTLRVRVPELAGQAADGVINFIQNLPARAGSIAAKTVGSFIRNIRDLPRRAMDVASDIFVFFTNVLNGLPNVVGGIVGRVTDAFLGAIQEGYNAAKNFADGLWRGFKDGLGINSPSFIEKQMWQMTDVIGEETRKMGRQVMHVQKLGKEMARTPLRVGDLEGARTAQEYARLVSLQADNQKRARTLAAASSRLPRDDARRNRRGENRRRDLVITNWREGRGYMREIADDAIYDDHDYNDSLGDM